MVWADVVIFSQFYGFDVIMWIIARTLRKPLVCSQANALFRQYRDSMSEAAQEAYARTIGIRMLMACDAVRVCNAEDQEILIDHGMLRAILLYPLNRNPRFPPISDDSDARTGPIQSVRSDDRFKVVVAGRMTHQKGVDLVAEAIHEMARAGSNPDRRFVFIFAGTSMLPRELRRLKEQHPSLIVNLGALPWHDFISVLEAVDLVLVPSRYESFGKVAAEAQSLGKPVIATDITGLREIVVDGETGFLLRDLNAIRLAATLRGAIEIRDTNPVHWRSLQSQARRHYDEVFGPRVANEQLDRFVTALTELGNQHQDRVSDHQVA